MCAVIAIAFIIWAIALALPSLRHALGLLDFIVALPCIIGIGFYVLSGQDKI